MNDVAKPTTEVKPEVDTSAQITASNELINTCKQIYSTARKNDLIWRWMLGKHIDNMYANQSLYESGILKRVSEELDISISDLSRFRKFYNEFGDNKAIDHAVEKGYSWSHFKVLNDLPDGAIKSEMKKIIDTDNPAPKTSEFQKQIDDKKSEQIDRASNSIDADSKVSTGAGSGAKESKSSPISPINKALKLIDPLCDSLGDILIAISDGVEFDNEKIEEKYTEALSELMTKLEELVAYNDKIREKTT